MTKEQFIELLREQVDKQDPVDGICSDIEIYCNERDLAISDDGLIDFNDLMGFFETVNWLEANEAAIRAVASLHVTSEGKINFKKALHHIV